MARQYPILYYRTLPQTRRAAAIPASARQPMEPDDAGLIAAEEEFAPCCCIRRNAASCALTAHPWRFRRTVRYTHLCCHAAKR